MVNIFCLVKTIGVKEDSGPCINGDFLFHVFLCRIDANGQVRLARQSPHVASNKQWCVVAGVAVVQQTCSEVEHANEDGNEHISIIAFSLGLVESFDNTVGLGLLRCHVTE